MARLIAIPVQGKGDAVLVVAHHADSTLMGFVTVSALAAYVGPETSLWECMMFVERHLHAFEQILLRKSARDADVGSALECVEIAGFDLAAAGVAEWRAN